MQKISIVTAHYNQASYVSQCIQSVSSIKYRDAIEYIFWDAGSSDGSLEILQNSASCFTKLIVQKDEGQADALNKAFEASDGDIMGFMNADDFYLPGGLESLIDYMESTGADVVYGGFLNINEDKCLASICIPTGREHHSLSFVSSVFEPATLWRRRVWEKYGPFDVNKHYVFGWEFLTKASSEFNFQALPAPVCINRIHSERKSADGSDERRNEILKHIQIYGDNSWQEKYKLITSSALRGSTKFGKIKPARIKPLLYPVFFPRVAQRMSYEDFRIIMGTLHPEVAL